MIKAILFDIFGVLYDSSLDIFWNNHLDKSGQVEFLPYFNAYDRASITKRELLREGARLSGLPRSQAEKLIFGGFVLNQGLLNYAQQLRRSHRVGLLTNIGASTYSKLRGSLEPHFDTVVASYRTGVLKPEPESYYLAVQAIGTPIEQCLLIDDTLRNIEGAAAVGMPGILYESFPQLQKELTTILKAHE